MRRAVCRVSAMLGSVALCASLLGASPAISPRDYCPECTTYTPVTAQVIDTFHFSDGDPITGALAGPDGVIWAVGFHHIGVHSHNQWRTFPANGGADSATAGIGRIWYRTIDPGGPLESMSVRGIVDRERFVMPDRECDVAKIALDRIGNPWVTEACFPDHSPESRIGYISAYDRNDRHALFHRQIADPDDVALDTQGFIYGGDGIVARVNVDAGASALLFGNHETTWVASPYSIQHRGASGIKTFMFYGPNFNFRPMPMNIIMNTDGRGGVTLTWRGHFCRITDRNVIVCDNSPATYYRAVASVDGSFYALDENGSLTHFRFDVSH